LKGEVVVGMIGEQTARRLWTANYTERKAAVKKGGSRHSIRSEFKTETVPENKQEES